MKSENEEQTPPERTPIAPDREKENPTAWPGDKRLLPDDSTPETLIPVVR